MSFLLQSYRHNSERDQPDRHQPHFPTCQHTKLHCDSKKKGTKFSSQLFSNIDLFLDFFQSHGGMLNSNSAIQWSIKGILHGCYSNLQFVKLHLLIWTNPIFEPSPNFADRDHKKYNLYNYTEFQWLRALHTQTLTHRNDFLKKTVFATLHQIKKRFAQCVCVRRRWTWLSQKLGQKMWSQANQFKHSSSLNRCIRTCPKSMAVWSV